MHNRTMSDGYMLRLPDGMRDRIRQRAEANRRSMNSEIVHYLDQALAENVKGPAGAPTPPDHEHNPIPERKDVSDD